MYRPRLWAPMRVAFLIPTLNEVEGIRATLGDVPQAELEAQGYQVAAYIVDGGSHDGTVETAESLGAHVVHEPRKGYGRAYKTGFTEVDADYIVTGDADATYPLERTPKFLETFRKRGLDFATFNRYSAMDKGAMSAKHKLGNWVLSQTLRTLFRVRIRDSQSGMWILTKQAVERLPLDRLSEGMAFSQEIKIEAFLSPNIAAAELPGAYRPRVGEAKLESWRDGMGNLRALRRHQSARNGWRDGQP